MKKILVVDDDFDQREIYQDLFIQSGYEVMIANDGLEALKKSPDFKPDLVFTGIMMPGMDGFELIKKLREDATMAHVPVIMFSHLGRDEDRKKAANLPNVEFMRKGLDKPITILSKVKELLSGSLKPSSAQEPKSIPMV